MLREMRIEGFRGIRSLELENLHPVNLIIGENNSGKTTVLEAIQLLKGQDVLSNLYQVAYKRENPTGSIYSRTNLGLSDLISYSFNDSECPMIQVWGDDDSLGKIKVGIRGEMYQYISNKLTASGSYDEDGFSYAFRGDFYYESETCHNVQEFDLGEEKRIRRTKSILIPMEYLNPITMQVQLASVKSMYNALRVREKNELIGLLRHFDQRIVGIERVSDGGRTITLLELDEGQMMPVSVFGDGIKKVLAIANAVVKAKGGIVLVDEFETGIHKKALPVTADWLYKIADEYETQIFLTTHSEEALGALADSQRGYDILNVYRLEHYHDDIYVKQFDGESLSESRRWGTDIF